MASVIINLNCSVGFERRRFMARYPTKRSALSRELPFPHLHNVTSAFGFTVRGPRIHQLAPLLQGVASAVRLFSLVSDDVRQSSFDNFAREIRDVSRPISEAGSKAVNGVTRRCHSADHRRAQFLRIAAIAGTP
jgi:hypothetical protein